VKLTIASNAEFFKKSVVIPIIPLDCLYGVDRKNSVLYLSVLLSCVCRTAG